jgi:hypothetical protein
MAHFSRAALTSARPKRAQFTSPLGHSLTTSRLFKKRVGADLPGAPRTEQFQEIKVKVASLKTTLLPLANALVRKIKALRTKAVSTFQTWGSSLRLAGKRLVERSRPHAVAVPIFAGQDFMESLIQRSVDAKLHALLQLRTACRVGCEATTDLKSDACAIYGWSSELIRAARKGATTLGFSERENLVLRYADDITRTPTDVDLLVSRQLRHHFTYDQIVEITAAICYENFRARFRAAMAGQTTLKQEDPPAFDRVTASESLAESNNSSLSC